MLVTNVGNEMSWRQIHDVGEKNSSISRYNQHHCSSKCMLLTGPQIKWNNVYFTVLFSLKNCLYLLLFCYLHYYINTMNYHAIFIRHSKIDAIYPHYSIMNLTNTSGLIIVIGYQLFVPSIIF